MRKYVDCEGRVDSRHTPACLTQGCSHLRPMWMPVSSKIEILAQDEVAFTFSTVGRLAAGYCSWNEPDTQYECPATLVLEMLKVEDVQGLATLLPTKMKGASLSVCRLRACTDWYLGWTGTSVRFGLVPRADDILHDYNIKDLKSEAIGTSSGLLADIHTWDLTSGDHVQVEFQVVRGTRAGKRRVGFVALSMLRLLAV